jgi:Putative zinc-finger
MTNTKCEDVRPQLPDRALGTLSETEVGLIRRHLRGCAACRAEAAQLDQGVATFASVMHVTDPPAELRDRVMAVLSEEWSDVPSQRRWSRRWLGVPVRSLAAAVVIIAGLVAWGAVAQVNATRFHDDAVSYRHFLDSLGGKDIRVGTIQAAGQSTIRGSVIMYDSERDQSWIMVLASAQGEGDLTVTVEAAGGRSIEVPFPLRFADDGEGWTGMVTADDISGLSRVVFTREDGTIAATADVPHT